MATAVILVALCLSLFGVFYMFFTTRNRERMAIIEKEDGLKALFSPKPPRESRSQGRSAFSRFSLKTGFLLTGIGIGFVISVLLQKLIDPQVFELLVVGIVFITGGLGLIGGYLMGLKLDK